MTAITGSRQTIQVEETQFRAPVSENTLQKVGAGINFINEQQRLAYTYEFAGPFRPNSSGVGGILGLTNNAEIVGISGRLSSNGVSGTTVIDLHLEQGGVDQGSIWSSQKLEITGGLPGVTYFSIDLLTNNSDASGSVTLPTFDSVNFDIHDQFRIDIDSNAVAARNLYINIWYRPR